MTGGEDPFARIGAALGDASGARTPRADDRVHVAPAPPDAPALPEEWRELGRPAGVWTYRDAAGAVLRHTLRFEAHGEKTIRPATLWRWASGRLAWRPAAEPGPRPLYGLDRLAARPSAPVLVVEGEKATDAAERRFPEMVAVTWPGGAKAVGKADWSPLQRREVIAWPDADDAGRAAARAVVSAVAAVGGVAAAVQLPAALPAGWDLADPWPPGFGQAAALSAAAAAKAALTADAVTWPFGIYQTDDGLFWEQSLQDGRAAPVRLCAPFDVLGEARDPDGGGWAVVIGFRDRDGREKTEVVSRALLAASHGEVRSRLAGEGLVVNPARGKADRFAGALAEVTSSRRMTLVGATGWASGDRFVLPRRVIGPPGSERVLFTGDAAALHYGEAGTLDSWRAGVAAHGTGNRLLTFALSLAFAGPLLRPLGLEGGGFHFRGPSSCGKTTLALAAGSVWGGGGPLGAGQSWRATANALEMVAYGHSETLLVLDELALVAPEEAGQAAYALSTGQAKGRAKTDGSLRRRAEWLAMILSTGEIGLADHIRASRRAERPMAGQELRLVDINADAGGGLGVWDALPEHTTPGGYSDAIKAACGVSYGLAGPAFVEIMAGDLTAARGKAALTLATFLHEMRREGDTGQVHRAAQRFGLVAAAGELATEFGVTPWTLGDAWNAAASLFERWADGFGRTARREEHDVIAVLRAAIERDYSRFASLADDAPADEWEPPAAPALSDRAGEARSLSTYGFRHISGATVFYLFHDTGWAEVFRGFDPKFAAKVVEEAGFLERGDGAHVKKAKRVHGQVRRFYWVRADIMTAGEPGD